jgi:hypothetical protein
VIGFCKRAGRVLATVVAAGLLGFSGGLAAVPFDSGSVVVFRTGGILNPTTAAASALAANGNPVFLDEYDSGGTYLRSRAMPTAVVGSNQPLFGGAGGLNNAQEGFLTRSANKFCLAVPGSSSNSANAPHVIARVSGAGTINTTTSDGVTSIFKGVATADCNSFWTTSVSDGVRYVASLGASTSSSISSTPGAMRALDVYGGQLFATTNTTPITGISAFSSLLPTTTATLTLLSGFASPTTPVAQPYGFFFAKLDVNSAGFDTLYVADSNKGIVKFALSSGTWTQVGTPIFTIGDKYRGLTGTASGTTVTLYAVKGSSENTAGGGVLVKVVDTTGSNAAFNFALPAALTTLTTIATAATNTTIRGVALAPESPQVTASISGAANGTISPAGTSAADFGAPSVFTVTPATGYSAAVSGTCLGALVNNTYTTSAVTGNCTVVASFSPLPPFTVTPSATGSGTITPNTPVPVLPGLTTTFNIAADSGYAVSMGGDCVGSLNLAGTIYTTNPVGANCSVIATFVATVNGACGAANGVATGVAPSANLCSDGSPSAVTTAPSQFTWTCNGFGGGGNASCSAPRNYTVTPSVTGGNGTATIPASGVVAYNAAGTVTITPTAGFATVMPVGGSCGGTLVGTTYTTDPITADCTVIASFAQITYTMTPSAGTNGTISPSGLQTVNAGATRQFTVTPSVGFSAAVGGTCGGSLVGTTYTTNAAAANCTVEATYTALPTFTVTPTTSANGTLAPPTPQTVVQNGTATFTPTPASGYSVVMSGCGGKMSGGTFTTGPITADCTVTTSFATKNILFVGNSYTFARVDPAMTFNAANVNDLTTAFNAAYPNGANSWPFSGPTCTGAAVQDGCFEPHPWGGVPGIFKALTVQAGLDYNVSLSTRNAASLRGHFLNTAALAAGNNVWDLRGNIASQKWDVVMVQGQSDEPLPANKSKNGDPVRFKTYANQIAKYVRQGNGQATDLGTTESAIYTVEGFGSCQTNCGARTIPPNFNANPSAKVYVMQNWSRPDMVEAHKCTVADYDSADGKPLVDPTCAAGANGSITTGENNVFYTTQLTTALNLNDITTDMNSSLSSLLAGGGHFSGVIPTGNAFQKAVDAGVVQNSGFYNASGTYVDSGPMNLWWLDRTHGSKYGSYLSALVHFARLTGLDPTTQFLGSNAVAAGLAISLADAVVLQQMAKAAVVPGAPTAASATAGNGQVTVTFTAPVNLGGLDITGYTATCGGRSVSSAGSPIVVAGLINGASVSCTVVATNSVGNSVPSAASSSVTPVTVPGAPVIGTAVAGDTTVSVVFEAPPSDGGSTVLSYAATCGAQSNTGPTSPITVSLLANGVAVTCTVTATNAVGSGAPSDPSNSVTPQAAQTISFPVIAPQPFAPSGTFAVAATSSSMLPVSFASLTSGACTVDLSTVTIVSAGTCTIRASQAGAAAFAAATPVDQDITVERAPQVITFAAQSPASQSFVNGGSFAVNPLATGGGSPNAVTYASQTTSVCATGGSNGATVTMLSTGLCTIAANQAGDSSYLPAVPVSQSVQVDAPSVVVNPMTVPSGTVGLAYVAQSLTATGGTAPHTFNVTVGVLPAGLTLTGAGSLSGTPTAAGTFAFTVTTTDTSTTGVGGPFTGVRAYSVAVAKGSQTISFASLPGLALGSAAFAVNASASSGLPVAISSQTTGVCTVASTTVTLIATGTCTVRASQIGDSNWNAATDVDLSFTVAAPTISLNPTTVPSGTVGLAYVAQSLTATGGAAPHTFNVTVGVLPAGLTLTGAGSLSGTPTAAGTFAFTVTATDSSSISVGGPFTGTRAYSIAVGKGLPVTTVTANLNPTVLGQTSVFTAVVTAVGPAVTGTVNFFDGASVICPSVALAGTQAQCATDTLPAGTRSITAVYSGDSHYLDSTSPVLQQTVNPSGSIVLTVTRAGSGSGTVQSSPLGINCGIDCSETYAAPTPVSLTATPSVGSIFAGWSGACAGRTACDLNMTSSASVVATFAPDTTSLNLDVDGSRAYQSDSDGLIIVRYLFGVRGAALVLGTAGAATSDPTLIARNLDDIKPLLDIDGDGRTDALTDGVLIMRYLLGLRTTALISGAISPTARRTTFGDIQNYLGGITPALP